jgi:hypothetical protein
MKDRQKTEVNPSVRTTGESQLLRAKSGCAWYTTRTEKIMSTKSPRTFAREFKLDLCRQIQSGQNGYW